MLITKKFGDSCNSFGLGLLKSSNESKETKESPLIISPLGLIQALEILRSLLNPNSAFHEKLCGVLFCREEDSETLEFTKFLQESKENETEDLFLCSLWTKNGRLLKGLKSRFEKENPSVYVGALSSKKLRDVRRWANKHLPWKSEKMNFEVENIEETLVFYSISSLSATIKNTIYESKSDQMLEIRNERLNYYENDFYQAVKLSFEGDKFFCILCIPKNKNSAEEVLKNLCDPHNWIALQKIHSSSERGRIKFPRISIELNFTLNDEKLNKFQIPKEEKLPLSRAFPPKMDKKISNEFYCNVFHTVMFEIVNVGDSNDSSSSRHHEKLKFDIKVDKPFIMFVQDEKTKAMLFSAVLSQENFTEEKITSRVRKNVKKTYRAGKSPPRGDLNSTLSFKQNTAQIKNPLLEAENAKKKDMSIIDRNLIPCSSMSETGKCSYRDECRFSHDVVAV